VLDYLLDISYNTIMEETKHFTIQTHRTESGKRPFRDWVYSLKDKKTRSVIRMRVHRLQKGNFGDCKIVERGVYELRIHYGRGFRVYFGKIENIIIVLLCGGDKSSQNKDIKKAQEYWELYKESHL
jgi:putative addiction module killer protein